MEALIINFNLNIQKQETLKTFLTTFRLFIDSQAFNTITILADHFFIYLIIFKNQSINISIKPITDIIDYKQNPFIYITTEYYTPKEFYNVIININTSKKFTVGYG